MVFTPAEEVQNSLVAQWELAVKAVRAFFREEWVEEPNITMLSEDLVVVAVLMEPEEVLEVAEDTLVEAVETMKMTPVEEGEGLIMLGRISKMNVVSTQLAMVRSPLNYCSNINYVIFFLHAKNPVAWKYSNFTDTLL